MEETDSEAERLQVYADLEDNEAGEYWSCLCDIWRYDCCMSNGFKKSVAAEIKRELKRVESQTQIVEKEIVHRQKIKTLVWDDE